jgi:D-3-phosphoglycerate dehydrogenase / 2-oxoglutarate reductase
VRSEKKALSILGIDDGGRSAQVLGIRSQTCLDAAAIAALPNLWVIGAFCIGVNQIDLNAAARAGVPVFNAPYSNTRSVAELVVGETILLMRRISEKNGAAHRGEWMKSAAGCTEIRGKTVGIVGYGHIGSQVSVLLEQLGMSVLFHDIVDKLPMGNAKRARHLEELLQRADVVTLHVPDTPETRNLIGDPQLERMKKGSFLINSSRGSVVDIDAVHRALQSGHLAGAAIDVFPKEPDHAGEAFSSPLQGSPNVILTPHIGGSTEEAQENIAAYVSGKIINFLQTGSTQGAVNFPEVDLPRMPGTHRILHIHKNVPGVLAKINSVFARRSINVESQILQTREQIGYLIVDVDRHISGHVLELMRHITETIKIRKIE